LFHLLAQAYLGPGDEAIYTVHGFLVYKIVILATGATPVVATETEFRADVDAILSRVTPRTRMVFIANPNNPTGTYIPFDEVRRLRQGLPENVILVLDGAYAEYANRNDYEAGIELVATTPNTIMTRTFSKIYGLASARVGWAYCPAPVADVLNRIRGPFNVTSSALAAGEAALGDQNFVAKNRAHNRAERERMAQQIGGLGLDFAPSAGNFILVKFGPRAKEVQEKLRRSGVIVREMEAYGLGDWLRVSIGTEEANARFIELLSEIISA